MTIIILIEQDAMTRSPRHVHRIARAAASALSLATLVALASCATGSASTAKAPTSDPKQQVVDLLKSFENADPKPLEVIDPGKYVQHNLGVADGLVGLKALLQGRPAGGTTVNTVRVFRDGDFVFAHTEYDFAGNRRVGFDIFRFESAKIVEHWDNLQAKAAAPSPGGHTMTDGPAIARDLDRTAANKALMERYMADLLAGRRDTFTGYFDAGRYLQHSPLVGDDLAGLFAGLQALAKQGLAVKYTQVHRVLAEGDFVLVVAEGTFGSTPSAFYDLYRIQDGKIAEHWDTIAPIPPRAEWKNANGKF